MSSGDLGQWADAALAPSQPARPGAALREQAKKKPTLVHPGHQLVFQALLSGGLDNVGLMPCQVNGAASSLIVMARETGEDSIDIMPLFVALASGMRITDVEGDLIWDGVKSGA